MTQNCPAAFAPVRALLLILAIPGLGFPAEIASAARDVSERPPGAFDYCLLAPSWKPGFCVTTPEHMREWKTPKGFALHGLSPQLEGDQYPSFCDGPARGADARGRFAHIYAGPSLTDHEGPKHGPCSSLFATDYFTPPGAEVGRVVVPSPSGAGAVLPAPDMHALKPAFVAIHPGLTGAGVTTGTRKNIVTEVDFCLSKAGNFTPC
ncbi:MAG TPA: hypothetical protein VK533_15095 [Sphingomonas sp.]|uniref:ribonuclease T2 family protein n=1 Tax=Sphingomonas sp. TaxID=28214 RepID=UPI002BBBE93D|nr:hypothetical protein [Sphingomonas sp.]HMI20860.1 hypothetical protein [Sphingomonas sp.]